MWKFESTILPIARFWNKFFATRPIFHRWSKNLSDFKPIFENSSNFDSRFLQRIRFWIILFSYPSVFESKKLRSIRFWKNIDFRRTEFVGTSIPHSQFLVSIHIGKTNQLAFPWFPENQYSEKNFFGDWRRQFSNQSF